VRPITRLTADTDRPAQRLDTVGQADQAGTARRVGPADAVVSDVEPDQPVIAVELDRTTEAPACLATLVRGFSDDVVGGHFDSLGQPSLRAHLELHRDRRAAGQAP
jgi:hypothetical protein